jgi:hypothetical protein
MITLDSVVVASRDQVSSDLAGESVILDLSSGTYYGLDNVGHRIWHLLQEPRTVAQIVSTLLQEYDVEPERCREDVLALLRRLVDKRLIEVAQTEER